MAKRKLDVIISVVDEFSGDMDSFIGGIQDMTSPVADLTKDLLLLEAAIGAVAGVFAAFAVGAAAEFETTISNIGTLVDGLAEDEIPGLTDAILQLSTEVPQTGVQIANAFYDIQSATGAGAEGFKLMEIASKAAIAGLTDTKTAADLLTTVMNSMGYEMGEAEKVADILFATVVKGKVTFDQLASNMGSFAALSKLAGISLEEVGAAYATLTAATGLQAESATYLRAAIGALLRMTDKSAKAFKRHGIATEDANGNLRNLLDIIRDIAKRGLNLKQISELFPQRRAIQAVAVLANNFTQYESALKLTTNAQGLMIKSFLEMSQTWENRWAAMASTYQRFQIQVGSSLKDTFLPLIDSIKNVFEALGKWEKETESIAKFIDKFLKPVVNDIGDALNILAENFDEIVGDVDFQPMLDALGEMGKMLQGLINVDFTTVEGWSSALQLVVDVATGVVNVTTGIIDGLKILSPIIGGAVEGFKNLDADSQKSIGKFLGLTTAVDALLTPLKASTTAIKGLITAVKILAAVRLFGLVSNFLKMGTSLVATSAVLQGSFLTGVSAATIGISGLSVAIGALVIGSGAVLGYFIDKMIGDLPVVVEFVNNVGDGLAKMGQKGRTTEFITNSQERLAKKFGITSGKLSDLTDAMDESKEASSEMAEYDDALTDKIGLMGNAIKTMQFNLETAARHGVKDIDDLDKSMEGLKDTSLETAIAISEAAERFKEIEKTKKVIAAVNELWRAGHITAGMAREQIGKLTDQIKELGGEVTLVEKLKEMNKAISDEEGKIKILEQALKDGRVAEGEATVAIEKHKQEIKEIEAEYKGLGEAHSQELIHIKSETFEILKMGGEYKDLQQTLSDKLGVEVDTSQAHGEIQRIGDELLTLTEEPRTVHVYVEYHDEGAPE